MMLGLGLAAIIVETIQFGLKQSDQHWHPQSRPASMAAKTTLICSDFTYFRLTSSKQKRTFSRKIHCRCTEARAYCKKPYNLATGVRALSSPFQLCSYSHRGVEFAIKTTTIPLRWNWSRLDDLFCLFTAKQGFRIHLSVTQGCSSVVFLWADEWGYHSGCLLFCSVSGKKKSSSWAHVMKGSCEGALRFYWPWDSHAAVEHTFETLV